MSSMMTMTTTVNEPMGSNTRPSIHARHVRGSTSNNRNERRRLPEDTTTEDTTNNKEDKNAETNNTNNNKDDKNANTEQAAAKEDEQQQTAKEEDTAKEEQAVPVEEDKAAQEQEVVKEEDKTAQEQEVATQEEDNTAQPQNEAETTSTEEEQPQQEQEQDSTVVNTSNNAGDSLFSVDLLPLEVNVTVTKLSLDEQVGLGSFGTYLLGASNKYFNEYLTEQNADLLENSFDSVSLRLTRLKEQDPLEELLLTDANITATQAVQVNITAVLDGSVIFSVPSKYDLPSTALVHILQLNAFGIPASALTQQSSRANPDGTTATTSTNNNIVFASDTLYTKNEAHKWYLDSLVNNGWDNPYLREAEVVYTDLYATVPFVMTGNDLIGSGRFGGDVPPQDATASNGLFKMVQYAGTTAVAILALTVLVIGFLWSKKRRAYQESQANGNDMKPSSQHDGSKKSKRNSSHGEEETKDYQDRDDEDDAPHPANHAMNTTAEMSVSPSYFSKDAEVSKMSKKSHNSAGTGGTKSSLNAVTKASKQIAKAEKKKEHKIKIFHHKTPTSSSNNNAGGRGRNMYQADESDEEGFEASRAPSSSTFFSPRYLGENSNASRDDDGSVMDSSIGEYTYNEQYTVNDDNMSMGFSLEGDDDLESVL